MDETVAKTLSVTFCLFSIIALTVFIILGFSSLEANEYGLDYSWLSKSVDKIAKSNGLYFLGIGHSFIRFPKTVQLIEFSNSTESFEEETSHKTPPIKSRTSDGLEVSLEISFQYSLQPENLYKLYRRFDTSYKVIFKNIATDILTEAATNYTAYDFFTERGAIKDYFQRKLNNHFNETCYANIEFLQLRRVELPTKFEDAIQDTEVMKQDIQKANAELNKAKVEIETQILTADFHKNATINLAEGEAASIEKNNEAEVESLRKFFGSKIEGLKAMMNRLNLTPEELIDYTKSEVVSNNGENLAVEVEKV